MSLINQMLRDLQQRSADKPAPPSSSVGARSRSARRRIVATDLLRSVPPIAWVAVGGLAGLVLLWGASDWLGGIFGPGATTVAKPPPEMVAIANAPAATPAPRRRVTPEPAEEPPPPPPLAYGASEVPPAIHPDLMPQDGSSADAPAASDTPQLATMVTLSSPRLPIARPPSQTVPASPAPGVPGLAVPVPGRLHPDVLPGAVNATNLALQQAAREAAAGPPPATTPFGQAEEAYREGRQAYEANDTERSLAALRQALRDYPGHLPARELLVDQLEMTGATDEAMALLQEGLVIAPDYTPFRKRAARMLLDRNDAPAATRTLTGNGLPRVESDPELHLMLAGIYGELGEHFLAAQTYRNLLVYDPRQGSYWMGLGDALAAEGQAGEARKAYYRALRAGGLSRDEQQRARAGAAR